MMTPIYIKELADEPWPEDRTFYVLGGNGLFLCRNHAMFRSCAPMRTWPSELARQESFLDPSYPRVPQILVEQLVGFFDAMAQTDRCEAGAYLLYDNSEKEVTVCVPKQVSTVSQGWSDSLYAIGLEYENLDPLPSHQMILGTVHSHVYSPAYSSGIDVHDEVDKPGLHIVVGKVDQEPPDLHVEAVVDGTRFPLDPQTVIEDYDKRRSDFPSEWIDQVTVKVKKSWSGRVYPSASSSYQYQMPYHSDSTYKTYKNSSRGSSYGYGGNGGGGRDW